MASLLLPMVCCAQLYFALGVAKHMAGKHREREREREREVMVIRTPRGWPD